MKNSKEDKKKSLLPLIASYFTEFGYRRATTSELASRCGVKEAILYRLWPSKKEMFLASLDFIGVNLLSTWKDLISTATKEKTALEVLLSYESEHFAELNNYLIIFPALNEADDPDIKESLQRMYFRIHSFLVEYITLYKVETGHSNNLSTSMLAWALMGIGTMVTITKHLGMLAETDRGELLSSAGQVLLGNHVSEH
jgi:TetR/AcrR family transcriptional regulator